MARSHPKKLLVEGKEDKSVLPHLLDAHFRWGDSRDEWPLYIEESGGIDALLAPGVIEAELKQSGLSVLGIVADANDDAHGRWRRIRDRCLQTFPDLPEEFPDEGLQASNEDGLSFGVWLMPDNRAHGMLETFLSFLVPEDAAPLWAFAQESCRTAKEDKGAPFKEVHYDKARIHTFLAWQDEPGESLSVAVQKRALDATLPYAQPFVTWLRALFRV